MARWCDSVPRGRVRRVAPLAGLTARTVCGHFAAVLHESAGDSGAVARYDRVAARRYVELLGRSRGVLMKVGQFLSMVDTGGWAGGVFRPYAEALDCVYAAVPVMDGALIDKLLGADLGSGRRYFAEWDSQPLASASIGQVHLAVLRDGRQVAVKVQYPGVAQAIEDDLANAELLTTFLRVIAAGMGVGVDVREVAVAAAARIREEVDYRREAASLAAFGELYRGHPFIRIPEVVSEASGAGVLTMTYLDGVDWVEAQNADQDLKNTWAEVIVRFIYSNRWLGGFLHADPHPSNYRFFPDGTVGFLDFGCVQALSEAERSCWYGLIRAVVEGREADVRDFVERAGFLAVDPTLSAEELYRWWVEIMSDIVAEPQPVTYTDRIRKRLLASLFDFRDARHPVARISYPPVGIFTARVQLGLVSICAALNATLPIRAISADMDGLEEPLTQLGREHHRWIARRG